MPLQPPGVQAPSGPFAPDGACGEAAPASPSGATSRLEPTGSTSASSPVASSLGAPSATKSRLGPRCQQVAFGLCPRRLFSSAARWSRAMSQSPRVQPSTAPQASSMSGVSSPKAARDAGRVAVPAIHGLEMAMHAAFGKTRAICQVPDAL